MILSVCNVPELLKVMRLVNIVITIIKITVPIILIVVAMLDYMKATSNGSLEETNKLIVKKVMAAVIIFMVPTFVNIIFDVIDPKEKIYISCLNNATTERINELYIRNMEKRIENARTERTNVAYQEAALYLSNIKDKDLKDKYAKELEAIKNNIDTTDSSSSSTINVSTNGLSYNDFNSMLSSMNTPTTQELEDAAAANNISHDYLVLIIGTTQREGYVSDPYLHYGWASAIINNNYTYSAMQGWDPYNSGEDNYYSKSNVEDGYLNASDDVKKSVYLALTHRNKKIVECNGMYSSTPSSYNLLYASTKYNCSIYESK